MATNKQFIANLKGPKGDRGIQGLQGKQGEKGDTGVRGTRWDVGTAMYGANTTGAIFADSGLSVSLVGDMYLNNVSGNIYRCIKAGSASVSVWVFSGNLKPENSSDFITGRRADGNLKDSAGAPPVSIKIKGATGELVRKNWLKVPNTLQIEGSTTLTATVNNDKSITFNGTTSSGNTRIFVNRVDLYTNAFPDGTYLVSGGSKKATLDIVADSVTVASNYSGETEVTIANTSHNFAMITVPPNTTFNNETYYFMVRKSSVKDSTYEPYIENTTYGVGESGIIDITFRGNEETEYVTASVPVDSPLYDEEYIYYEISGYGYLYKDGVEQDLTDEQKAELASLYCFEGDTTVECEAVLDIVYFKNNNDAAAVVASAEYVGKKVYDSLSTELEELRTDISKDLKDLEKLTENLDETKLDKEIGIVTDSLSEWKPTSTIMVPSVKDMCYGGGIFVAVGGGYIDYSRDGNMWLSVYGDDTFDFAAVTYDGDMFVAVDSNGYIHKVLDSGVYFGSTPIDESITNIRDIAYGNGMYVMVCDDAVWYSSDLETWDKVSNTNYEEVKLTKVIYADGKFVAIGTGGNEYYATANVWYSTNAIDWTRSKQVGYSAVSGDYVGFTDITYGNGVYVLVGDTDGTDSDSPTPSVQYSTDLITWNDAKCESLKKIPTGIDYNDNHFIFVAGSYVGISEDGINWTITDGAGLELSDVICGNYSILTTIYNSHTMFRAEYIRETKTVETALNDIYAAIRKLGGDL